MKLNILKQPMQIGYLLFALYFFMMLYVGSILHSYYQNETRQTLEKQLTTHEQLLKTKLLHISHLLYSIDAYQQLNGYEPELFLQLAQSQLQGIDVPLRLESYALIKPQQQQVLTQALKKAGHFDFKIKGVEANAEHMLVINRAAPVAEYGHTVGESVALNNAHVARLQASNQLYLLVWPNRENKWSILIEQGDVDGFRHVLGISFLLDNLLDSLFSDVYLRTEQHLQVAVADRLIFSSDWKNTFSLSELAAGASSEVNFFGEPIKLTLYSKEQLSHSLLDDSICLIIAFEVIALLCGLMVLLHVRTLLNRNELVNKTVVERTACLAKTNQQLERESSQRLIALQQQLAAEKKYKSVFLNSHEGLFVLNEHGYILEANPAFQRLLLSNHKQSTSMRFSQLMADEHSQQQWLSYLQQQSNHQEFEWLGVNGQGKSLWLRQTGNWATHDGNRRYEGRLIDITQHTLFHEQLKYKAQHDGLTNLLNRQTFLDALEVKRKATQDDFILLYIDLDRFKLINDTLGHIAGDKLLIEFAARMQILMGFCSSIARLGGDEFAILIKTHKLLQPLEGVMEDLLGEIRRPFTYQRQQYTVSGSVGVRPFKAPCNECTAEKLLHDADVAMYEAKRRGKNGYYIYSDSIADEVSRKLQVEKMLHESSVSDELALHLQPMFCNQGRKLNGFEALLRWYSPTLGHVSPAEFIPIAEECGKIVQLGQWVFERALSFIESLSGNEVFISINVSPIQLHSQGFLDWLESRMQRSSISCRQIKIELTESAMMAEEDSLIEPLLRLHSLGFGIYIDDFGTGYSSLSRLTCLPVTGLKIDRSFINDLEHRKDSLQLVEAICAIAKSFNLTVTAEGIETDNQLEKISKLYCHYTQGYLMSRPLSEQYAEQLYNENYACLNIA